MAHGAAFRLSLSLSQWKGREQGGYRQNHRRVPRGHVQAGPIAQIGFHLRCDETRLLLMSISS